MSESGWFLELFPLRSRRLIRATWHVEFWAFFERRVVNMVMCQNLWTIVYHYKVINHFFMGFGGASFLRPEACSKSEMLQGRMQ